MAKWFNLIFGGLAGTLARYVLSGLVYRFLGTAFPYGTFMVNLTGCFLIGLFEVLSTQKFILDPNARVLLMAGFCGAFTTFSTFMLETANLLNDGESFLAAMNVVASVGAGFLFFKLGMLLGKII